MKRTKITFLATTAQLQTLSTTEKTAIKGGFRKIGDAVGESTDADGGTR
ncbi:MAG: hypothetical protein AAFV25_15865 [Bacteroidota bacterium]